MTTTNGGGLVGAISNAPKVASPLENEIQGLFASTDQLTGIVNALSARLISVLRQPEPKEEVTGEDQMSLSPLPSQIRENKQAVFRNVLAIKDLLDRLEL